MSKSKSKFKSQTKQDLFLDILSEHFDLSVDPFGNISLTHKPTGSTIAFTMSGDIRLEPVQDLDIKTGRWFHANSDVQKIKEHLEESSILCDHHGNPITKRN